MTIYDTIIIGAGPAGMTAAIYAKRANLSVLLLDRLAPGGQMLNTNEIENYTGTGKINGAELAIQMFTHTQELGVEFDEKTVTKVEDHGEKKVLVCDENQTRLEARSVIVATGCVPRTLNVEGEEQFKSNGISWCAICDGPQYKDKDIVVIGGGNSAVEESIYLASFCRSVTIVTLFDLTADPMACDRLRSLHNVTIHTFQQILAFKGEETIQGVSFKSTQTGEEQFAPCDGVFEYIGFAPQNECVNSLNLLDKFGNIPVDSAMRTRIPGLYAAGDVTVKELRQVITACSDGAIAAQKASNYLKNL